MTNTKHIVEVPGHGTFAATESAMHRFTLVDKVTVAKLISEGYGYEDGKLLFTFSHFCRLPKATLVVMAGDMFGEDPMKKLKA